IYSPLSCSAHAPAPRQLSTLALHDALPISSTGMLMATTSSHFVERKKPETSNHRTGTNPSAHPLLLPSRPSLSSCSRSCSLHLRSEEHTSELQSCENLVCRLLLEKKNSPYN